MKKKLIAAGVSMLALAGIGSAENISNAKEQFTLKSGDYEVVVSKECKHTMASISWKGHKVVPLTGYNGTVLVYPKGMVGCGHTEGGMEEQEKSFSMTADGAELQPETGKTYSANKFSLRKVSMLGELQLTGEIQVSPEEIRVTRSVEAMGEQKITNLYLYMFCFSPKFKEWVGKEPGGKELSGTFTDSEQFLMNADVKWAAMFDPEAGKGVGFVYPEPLKGKDRKTTFWDRKVYHKFYLFMDVPAQVEKGFTVPPKTVVVRCFAADAASWKAVAEQTLSK